jgi:hypothetical protein
MQVCRHHHSKQLSAEQQQLQAWPGVSPGYTSDSYGCIHVYMRCACKGMCKYRGLAFETSWGVGQQSTVGHLTAMV